MSSVGVARWTARDVLGFAPDSRSARAARSLAATWPWSGTGATAELAWGNCQGSAPAPYHTCVALAVPSFSCSCPSRKHPCKHALALLLLWADSKVPAAAEPPAWALRQSAAGERQVVRRRMPDPQAQARRAAVRAGRIAAGLEELDRWLHDLVRSGLAAAQARPPAFWAEMAARLVDAQAPGAAGLVRRLGGTMRSGTGWEERALAQAARLHLLASGWSRLADLDGPVRAVVRARVGWPVPIEEVLTQPTSRDRWHVAGRWETPLGEGDRLRVQRTWLWGAVSERPALVLEFALPTSPFRSDLPTGTVIDAEVAFYPGPAPLRAVVAAREGLPEPMLQMPGWLTIEEAFAAHGDALARDPWLDRWPVLLRSVVASEGGLRDAVGALLPVRRQAVDWRLVALSGGRPIGVMGELEEGMLRPLAAVADGRYVAL